VKCSKIAVAGAALCALAPLAAQEQVRRATMRDIDDHNGKCTIEVVVDQVAEVEVRGDLGRLITYSGQMATWSRFECNAPLPRDPVEFRLKGIDGRGRVELVRDPRSNGGTAVVRIEDRQGGREGYTFDLIWRGGLGVSERSLDRPWQSTTPRRGIDQGAAIRACQEEVRRRAGHDFHLREVNFHDASYDDRAARHDRVIGVFDTHDGGGRQRYNYTCAVDSMNGRIVETSITPMATTHVPGRPLTDDPVGYGRQAMDNCRSAVSDRLRHDGYRDIEVRSAAPDSRPGHEQRVLGRVSGRRDGRTRDFDYFCAVDFGAGRVNSVRLEPR
jgi:hypothetical protein